MVFKIAAVLFCLAIGSALHAADDPSLIRVDFENLPAGCEGHFRLFKDNTEVQHHGLDHVIVTNGSGQVTCGSGTQFNYKGQCNSLSAQFRIAPNTYNKIEVRATKNTKVKIYINNQQRQGEDINSETKLLILP